ncbi:MAG: SMC-Scp complex subunit ScpB ['Candidatus Kapabacteria' thiocyanatum]|uniref:SMC-Scp complex subunit ScpB n=1 Tax=Candidatus Kapaibacterium thiocyanatum TaxID=1895771 RepID=A0A1M3KXC5_9BACT|nr:SMC-Scp complex subunit ScpB ['Candidatus Kapabacteria' thiocyanatum]OJX57025.1 MAG: SMC-Scp complex subunit ScpB ['Candidatus Kapabacteria' thiocyanatum]
MSDINEELHESGEAGFPEEPTMDPAVEDDEATGAERLNVPYFFTLGRFDQLRALESLIFASDDPLSARAMHRILVLEDPSQTVPGQQSLPLDGDKPQEPPKPPFQVPVHYFDDLVDEINDDLEKTDRPFRIVKIAGGYQFATTPQHGQLVQRLLKAKNRKRLTQAALETLAIVAYRQPITKAEVDAIRGVNSGEVVNSLTEKQLVAMVGRAETPGKPLLYGTTDDFLRVFGLNSLSDLPKLREIDDLLKTTTTMIDMDDTIQVTTDHRTLRRQISLLLDGDTAEAAADTDANSGAYWHSPDEHGSSEEEGGGVDPGSSPDTEGEGSGEAAVDSGDTEAGGDADSPDGVVGEGPSTEEMSPSDDEEPS